MAATGAAEPGIPVEGGMPRRRWLSPADGFTAARVPLAVAFVLVNDVGWRVAILAVASISDFADGVVARRWGGSRLGAFLDPVADKLFMAGAFGVVLASGALTPLDRNGVPVRAEPRAYGFPNVAIRSIRQTNSTRFSSMPGSRRP